MDENQNNDLFPIIESNGEARMKNISLVSLSDFHGLTTKYPNTFMFEFVVVCRTYDCSYDEENLKLFPSTQKDAALCWFISQLGGKITT